MDTVYTIYFKIIITKNNYKYSIYSIKQYKIQYIQYTLVYFKNN